MALIINRIELGEVGVKPGTLKMISTGNLATVTTAGYLNTASNFNTLNIAPSDIIEALYSYNATSDSGTFALFRVSISNGLITLSDTDNLGGDVNGPALSTDSAIALFDGSGGKTLKNSEVTIDSSNIVHPTAVWSGFTTIATAAGTTTLTIDSDQQIYFTGTLAQTLKLPAIATLLTGASYKIVNGSTGVITIQSSNTQTITLLGGGVEIWLTLVGSVEGSAAWFASPIDDTEAFIFCLSDETTEITSTGVKVTARTPYTAVLSAVKGSLTTASSTVAFVMDVAQSGSSVLGNKISIDATELTSVTAVTQPTITTSVLTADSQLTFSVNTAGASATGAKITLYLTRS